MADNILKLLWFLLILKAINIVRANDTTAAKNEYYDPNDDAHQLFLWHGLFTKLNTLLLETDKINQNLLDLNKRFDDLNKRQEDQEKNIEDLMELTKLNTKHRTESCLASNISQGDLKNQLATFMADIQLETKNQITSFLDAHKSQSTHENEDVIEQTTGNFENSTWTTIMRRKDGSVDFYRNWTEYKNGFGKPPNGEFFIGLDKLHRLTTQGPPQQLMVILKDWKNETRTASYNGFQIGDESEKYAIKELGNYSGDVGNSLEVHKNIKFSTFDQDSSSMGCAKRWHGAWWFVNCYHSHLFGPYRPLHESRTKGVIWMHWKGHDYSLQFAEMKIRPKWI